MTSRVIICEDEQFIRWALAEHLRDKGYEVLEACNGVECLNLVKKNQVDAILLDLVMPKMDGLQVIEKLREMGNKVPVFVLSGYNKDKSITDVTKMRVDGFIQKPYYLADISKLLEDSIGLKKRSAATVN